jgi:hypothetical protein
VCEPIIDKGGSKVEQSSVRDKRLAWTRSGGSRRVNGTLERKATIVKKQVFAYTCGTARTVWQPAVQQRSQVDVSWAARSELDASGRDISVRLCNHAYYLWYHG